MEHICDRCDTHCACENGSEDQAIIDELEDELAQCQAIMEEQEKLIEEIEFQYSIQNYSEILELLERYRPIELAGITKLSLK